MLKSQESYVCCVCRVSLIYLILLLYIVSLLELPYLLSLLDNPSLQPRSISESLWLSTAIQSQTSSTKAVTKLEKGLGDETCARCPPGREASLLEGMRSFSITESFFVKWSSAPKMINVGAAIVFTFSRISRW
jgi:hypothetical protein